MQAAHVSRTAVVAVAAALLTGCNPLDNQRRDVDVASNWENNTDLVSEYGGYAFTDEKASFGESEFSRLEIAENSLAAADSDTVATPNSFLVRVMWGQLHGNSNATEVIDWSGAFSVSSGRLAALRTLAFERSTDRLLRRDDRQVLPYESKTRPHFDGLLLLIHDSDNDPGATLSMRSGPYSGSWTFEELRRANQVIRVDDQGNALSVTGMSLPDDAACLGGAVRGHWVQRVDQRGAFRGLWMSRLGRPLGHMRGHFGVNAQGQNVWFAKIIGRDGTLIGLARGSFEPNTERPGGTFSGHWAANEGKRSGDILGHYLPARSDGDRNAGFFQARWKSDCDSDPDRTEPTDPPLDRPAD
jgi:hypothetical protein